MKCINCGKSVCNFSSGESKLNCCSFYCLQKQVELDNRNIIYQYIKDEMYIDKYLNKIVREKVKEDTAYYAYRLLEDKLS